jgi:hypothetical protein
MIHHRIFPKGEYCHALISSKANPNILFQVRGLIYDVSMDPYNPQYLIKIIRFYDDINFIKRHFIGHKFQRDFIGHDTTWTFNRNMFNTREDFEQHIQNQKNPNRYMIVADSVMCTKTLTESTKLYNTIESFMVEKSIRDIYDAVTRTQYRKGKYAFSNRDEFRFALKRFLKDKIDVTEEYLDDILNRPSFEDLDDIGA